MGIQRDYRPQLLTVLLVGPVEEHTLFPIPLNPKKEVRSGIRWYIHR